MHTRSRSAKTSWIEIPPRYCQGMSGASRSAKTSWIEIYEQCRVVVCTALSRSTKTSWIEIMRSTQAEERYESRSAKTSWIDILTHTVSEFSWPVEVCEDLVD